MPGSHYGYDPLGRLFVQGATSSFLRHDGTDLISEQDNSTGVMLRRYVYGDGGEPLVWYEGTWTYDRHWLHGDERGSVIALSNDAGNLTDINRYDEYGNVQGTLNGRFGYTGQAWVPEAGLYDYLIPEGVKSTSSKAKAF